MKKTKYGSYKIGELPKGCKKCVKGTKLVLYVTGLCPRNCFYCPLSERRQGDKIFANERPIEKLNEILKESEAMNALGAGLTGGDPLVKIDRTVKILDMLKTEYGDSFHIHLYTTGKLATEENLEKLKEAKLDEIRFHPNIFESNKREWDFIQKALNFSWDVGGEVPILPKKLKPLKDFSKFLDKIGADFLNLNELELSKSNSSELELRNMRLINDEGSAVKESLNTGLKFLKWAENNTGLDYHLCPSKLKDNTQMRNRLLRMAKNNKKPYETVSEEGLLRKVIINSEKPVSKIRKILEKYDVPEDMMGQNSRGEVEIAWWIGKDLQEILDLDFYFVEEYPTWDKLETFRSPLEDL